MRCLLKNYVALAFQAAAVSASVGINRRGVVNERVIQERSSEPSLAPSHARAVGRPHLKRWTGVYAGWVSSVSSENCQSGRRRCQNNRKATRRRAQTRARRGPAESKTPCMHRNSTRENRETPSPPAASKEAGRWEKAMSYKTHMHGGGESYSGIVPAKQPNKGGGRSAEVVEGRPLTKENTGQPNPSRTPSRESGPNGLDRVREAAKKDGKLQFTGGCKTVCVNAVLDKKQGE